MQNLFDEILASIAAPDEAAMEAARARQLSLAKLPRSLGRLEEISVQIAGITGRLYNRADATPSSTMPLSEANTSTPRRSARL